MAYFPIFQFPNSTVRITSGSRLNAPDLQSSGTENTRTLVLGQVRGGSALVIGDLHLTRLLHDLA
jgi:hypothetical protein